jgi:hypothetical protein
VGKQDGREYCLGCGKDVAAGVMTCFDCIASVAPEFADKILQGAQFYYDSMRKWHRENTGKVLPERVFTRK